MLGPGNTQILEPLARKQQKMRSPQITGGLWPPFWELRGESADHPTADTMAKLPSKAMADGAEECERPTNKERQQKKRANWAQGNQASSHSKGKERSAKETKNSKGKGKNTPQDRFSDIRQWFEAKGRGESLSLEQDKEGGQGSRTKGGPLP